MAVLAADVAVSTYGTPTKIAMLAGATDTFYKGGITYILEAGGVTPLPASGTTCAGICAEQVSATSGSTEVEVYIEGTFEVPLGTNISAEDEGVMLGIDLDATLSDNWADTLSLAVGVDDVALGAGDIIIGRIVRVKSATMIISIHPVLMGAYEAGAGTGMIE